jgi:hypothetical protein
VSKCRAQDKGIENLVLTCRQRRGNARIEVADEPAETPAPRTVVPVEAADAEVTTRVAVDSAPEEHCLTFPLLRNEMRVGEEVVQDVRRQSHDLLVHEFLAKLIPLNPFVPRSLLFGEMEHFLLRRLVPLQGTLEASRDLFLRRQDLPFIGTERLDRAVDDMLHDRDLGVPAKERQDFPATILVLGECIDVGDFPASFGESNCEFVGKPTANV